MRLTVTISAISWTKCILLILFVLLALTVVILGLDNTTGIIIGIGAITALITAFTYRWSRIRNYLFLLAGAFFGSILLAGTYMEIAIPLAQRLGGIYIIQSTGWNIYYAIISYGILIGGISCALIGICGALVLSVTRLIKVIHKRTLRHNT